MTTLLTTNILLALIVLCFIVITILLGIALIYIIGTAKKIKHITTVFDDDVIRARSVVVAIKDLVMDKLFGQSTPKKKK